MTTPKTIGRYEVIDELGRGAMGSVLRAKDPTMGRTVAIKTILAAALNSEHGIEFRERFNREARAAGALAHPGIVPVYDVGDQDGMPYLVMEYVQGRTLDAAIKKGERYSLERVSEIGEQIADALNFAHRNGVIHRDIKPANILMTSREVYGNERPRITDFGVAKLVEGELTTTGQMLGTPAFMPPEQFTGAPIDGRTDIFSLGVILYQLATGEQPFPGETMTSVSYKIVHTDPIPPAKLNPSVPAKLDAIIMKCLAKSPADRYQSGEELAQDLAALRGVTPAQSTPLATPLAASAVIDPDATIDSTMGTKRKAAAQPAVPQKSGKSALGKILAIAAVLLFLVIAAGAAAGWYYLKHRNEVAAANQAVALANQNQASADQALNQMQAPSQPKQPTNQPAVNPATQAARQKPSPASKQSAAQPAIAPAQQAVVSTPPVVAAKPLPRVAAVSFDPFKLDPKTNAHFKIDPSKFPAGLTFIVELDGQLLYKGNTDNRADFDKFNIPPGVHQVQLIVTGSNATLSSNVVSTEFVAKKHLTFKVEYRSSDSSQPAAKLDPKAQLVASIKTDFFHF
jgi:serine/threonine-protein kinase